MGKIDYLYDLISKTETTLIGYQFSDERIKDEIISNLGRTKKIDLSSSFSMKSILRDMKIDQVLNEEENFDYLLLDINDIRNSYIKQRNFTNDDINRAGIVKSTIQDVILSIRDIKSSIRLILTCPLQSGISVNNINYSFMGGSSTLYISDLALIITQQSGDKVIQLVKSRKSDLHKTIKI